MNISLQRIDDAESQHDVVVILEWNEDDYPLYTFNVSVEPLAQQISNIESTQVQLVLSYNTLYNVTIVGKHLCRLGRVFTTVELNYTKDYISCNSLSSNITNATLSGIVSPHEPRCGDRVVLSCPPGLILTGPNTTTCMKNGEWEPDPRHATCRGKNLYHKLSLY